ncbi:MAG: PilZ domain-containing protein [Candidatus Omnitrophota bacterium]
MAQEKNERRKYERYDTEVKIYFQVDYDFKTKVQFQILPKQPSEGGSQKYSAISRNVSAEGLCFTSSKRLDIGEKLLLEVYLPRAEEPISMEGEVRWSRQTSADQRDLNQFDTGVRLITVQGKDVNQTIEYDEAHRVVWSAVLEAVFGNFKKLADKKKRN